MIRYIVLQMLVVFAEETINQVVSEGKKFHSMAVDNHIAYLVFYYEASQ